MRKTRKRVVGKQVRETVDQERLRKAVKAITEDHLTLREAAKKFQINHVSIYRRLKNPNTQCRAGRTTALSHSTELSICEYLIACVGDGYQLTLPELQQLITQYLAENKMQVPRFKNNIPGVDYLHEFLKRHRDILPLQLCQSIRTKRHAGSTDFVTVDQYNSELEKSLEDVPAKNIFYYDKTYFNHDPGGREVFGKEEVKYVEQIMYNSKTDHVAMFCGSVLGQMLPTYVAFKGDDIGGPWLKEGLPKIIFSRTKKGLFDEDCFQSWLKTIVVPALQSVEGTKILIGNNLSTYMSQENANLCRLHAIKFVFLPSNATSSVQNKLKNYVFNLFIFS